MGRIRRIDTAQLAVSTENDSAVFRPDTNGDLLVPEFAPGEPDDSVT